MLRSILSCISQLWEFMTSTSNAQTSFSSTAHLGASPSNPQAPSDLAEPSSSQSPSSFISTLHPTAWDVFLSFRGEDTRYNFTSHLYDKLVSYGIRTFMDNPELHSGDVIKDSLIQAIRDSKVYVVIFSEDYASSRWCLDELVEIYKCKQTMERLVIPVFYKIDASVVRHQIGSFKNAFKKHETRFVGELDKVKLWRLTLSSVADISGKYASAKSSEADIINKIVEEIMLEVNPKTLDVAKYAIGLESRLKQITSLLNSSTEEGVIKLGIYGMGGVGKTTIAKALYNQLLRGKFQGNCFLANIRDVSGRPNGPESLQQQLIGDVLKSKDIFKVNNVDEGINFIEKRICSKRILLVLDDLDHYKQYESLVRPFASGSVVLVTTRDQELLDTIEVESKYRYKVHELDDTESLTLFTRHAFGNAKPNKNLMVLSGDILHHAGGLPLALEVFGSSLYKQSKVGWQSFIEKLQRIPNSTIQQRLMISLDALESDDPMLKKLFLDIACFFIGCDKNWTAKRMESYCSYAGHKIEILRKRCLLTINKNSDLEMHDLLRDMGREIARNNYPDEPEKQSRLYVSEDICNVLKKYKGTKAIEGIYLRRFDSKKDALKGAPLTVETFEKMSKLRLLYLENAVNITGNFEPIFEDLRWLCWKYCPWKCLPSTFCPPKLVILELHSSSMRTMWELQMVPPVFEKLKTLDMSYSLRLTTTPDFTKLPCLEVLNLQGCKSLEEVHVSISSLSRLVSFNLCDCKKLRSIQDSICNLRVLKSLTIGGCTGLEALPSNIGFIQSLTELSASNLYISKLPNSIWNLRALEVLNISNSRSLKALPIISSQIALQILDLSCSGLTALPSGISQLLNLRRLDLTGCENLLSITELPPNLKELLTCSCKSMKILSNLSNLKHLEVLELAECSELTEITGLEGLTSLKQLYLDACNSSPAEIVLTKQLIQKYSKFGHQIRFLTETAKFPKWITKANSTRGGSTLVLDLPPNVSNNPLFLGIIVCCVFNSFSHDFSLKNTAKDIIYSSSSLCDRYGSSMVIVPRSMLSLTDEDHTIELTVKENDWIYGIHLLYDD